MTVRGIYALKNLLGLFRQRFFGASTEATYLNAMNISSVEFYESGEIKRIELH